MGDVNSGQSITRVSASPPSKLRLKPNLSERPSSTGRFSLVISLPSQEPSRPPAATAVMINRKSASNSSRMYCT